MEINCCFHHLIFQFAAVIFFALIVSISAHPYAVIEVAKVASPVGSHGPALINLHWPNSWPGSYWDNGHGASGSWGGSSGTQKTNCENEM